MSLALLCEVDKAGWTDHKKMKAKYEFLGSLARNVLYMSFYMMIQLSLHNQNPCWGARTALGVEQGSLLKYISLQMWFFARKRRYCSGKIVILKVKLGIF